MDLAQWCNLHGMEELLECYRRGDNSLPAEEICFSSPKKVNWKCNVCQLEWTLSPNHMNRRSPGRTVCPYCARKRPSYRYNLALMYPELVPFWDPERNSLPMEQYLPGSRKQASWHCPEGHRWEAPICDQTVAVERRRKGVHGMLCPVCRKPPSLAIAFPALALQWDTDKNGSLTPWDVTPSSNRKVSWICPFNPSHRWADRVGNRVQLLRGCPVCARRYPVSYAARALYYYLRRENVPCDLEKRAGRYRIDIALSPPNETPIALELDGYVTHQSDQARARDARKDQFLYSAGYRVIRIREDPQANGRIRFERDQITYPQSDRNLWLDAMIAFVFNALLGHAIQPDHRRDHWKIEENICLHRKSQSLAAQYPQLAAQWSSKNGEPPDTVSPGSNTLRWWICPQCHWEYQAKPLTRIRQHCGCPYCSNRIVLPENSLKTLYPEIAKEWNGPRNGSLRPEAVAPSSRKKVWWCCAQGHEWQTCVFLRTRKKGTSCPVCQIGKPSPEQSLAARRPAIAADWDPERNLPFRSVDVGTRSNRVVWWQCPEGHQLRSTVRKRCASKGCPLCAQIRKAISAE